MQKSPINFLHTAHHHYWASQAALVVKNLPPLQETEETRVQPLGHEDPLEEGVAAHSRILAWRISMDRGAWRAIVHRVAKSQTRLK